MDSLLGDELRISDDEHEDKAFMTFRRRLKG